MYGQPSPWDVVGTHMYPPQTMLTGIPLGYEAQRRTPVIPLDPLDEPRPHRNESKSHYISRACEEALRKVYKLLLANQVNDEAGSHLSQFLAADARIPLEDSGAPSSGSADILGGESKKSRTCAGQSPTATVSSAKFATFRSFPSFSQKSHLSLSSKLAMTTPCNPDQLVFSSDPDDLLQIIEPLGVGFETSTAQRASRITAQWLRESFGDENIPKPQPSAESAANPVGLESSKRRRNSLEPKTSQEAKTSNEPGSNAAAAFNCNGCKKAMKLQSFRVRCAECEDFDLCESCFCEGVEIQNHRRDHYYIPIGPNQFPLFHSQWSADEELFLLDAVGKYGFGNWHDVAEHVSSATSHTVALKDKDACEKRYFEFHLLNKANESDEFHPFSELIRTPPYPHWKEFIQAMKELTDDSVSLPSHEDSSHPPERPSAILRPAGVPLEDPAEPGTLKIRQPLIMPPPQLPPRTHVLGFLPLRGDFENEHDNSAELAVADLDIRENESPMEKEVKLKILEHYNCVLDDRMRRKKLIIERRLFDQKWVSQHDRLKSPEERSLQDLIKPIWKHVLSAYSETSPPLFNDSHSIKPAPPQLQDSDIEDFVHLLLEDRSLVDRLNLLTAWRQAGLKTLKDILDFGGPVAESHRGTTAQTTESRALKTLDGAQGQSNVLPSIDPSDFHIESMAAGVRSEFFSLIKEMLDQEIQEAMQEGKILIDPESGRKIFALRNQSLNVMNTLLFLGEGETIPLSDFAIQARVELKATNTQTASSEPGLTDPLAIPKKRKGAPSRVRAQPVGRVTQDMQFLHPNVLELQGTSIQPLNQANDNGFDGLFGLGGEDSPSAGNPSPTDGISSVVSTLFERMRGSPITSDAGLCPSPTSEPAAETEEGEIEDDEDDDIATPPSGSMASSRNPRPAAPSQGSRHASMPLRSLPPPPPPFSAGFGPKPRHRDLPGAGKGEKRQRRGSGGLGLAPIPPASIESLDAPCETGSADEEDMFDGAEEEGSIMSQKKSASIVSSNLEGIASDDDESLSRDGGADGISVADEEENDVEPD